MHGPVTVRLVSQALGFCWGLTHRPPSLECTSCGKPIEGEDVEVHGHRHHKACALYVHRT